MHTCCNILSCYPTERLSKGIHIVKFIVFLCLLDLVICHDFFLIRHCKITFPLSSFPATIKHSAENFRILLRHRYNSFPVTIKRSPNNSLILLHHRYNSSPPPCGATGTISIVTGCNHFGFSRALLCAHLVMGYNWPYICEWDRRLLVTHTWVWIKGYTVFFCACME